MDAARSRFARRALLVLVLAVATAAMIAVTVVLALSSSSSETRPVPLIAVIAVVLVLLGLAGPSLWNSIGLLRIRRLRPDALVFLARREPTLAPDLPLYLHRRNIAADVSDKWVPAVIDERGMAAWSSGFAPREVVLMDWSEIGDVVATDFVGFQGGKRFGITVDVRPFPTPLIVRVGYSLFGLQGQYDNEGTRAVAAAADARRPVREPSA